MMMNPLKETESERNADKSGRVRSFESLQIIVGLCISCKLLVIFLERGGTRVSEDFISRAVQFLHAEQMIAPPSLSRRQLLRSSEKRHQVAQCLNQWTVFRLRTLQLVI